MNKFAKLFAGMAVISLAASCSSDDPMGNAGNGTAEGDGTLYLAVNIQDAASLSKADALGQLTPGNDYENENGQNPQTVEHAVNSARFFFFDANGVFVTEANVWSNGTENGKNNNVEFESTNMLVLKGVKDKGLPRYLFTVVNCPEDFTPEMTLNATAAKTAFIRLGEEQDGNFVMSTTSFNPSEAQTSSNLYDAAYPFANVVTEGNFITEPKPNGPTIGDITNPVVVYVERLATKTTFVMDKLTQNVTVTVGGYDNDENSDDMAKTTFQVTIDGFAVTNVETNSFIAKNINGFGGLKTKFTASALTGWNWNKATDFRSFWGMSTTYGEADARLNRISFDQAAKHSVTAPYYSYETTNTLANVKSESGRVKDSAVPCVIFTATISQNGKPVSLVEYQGIYYKEDQFVKYGMARLQAQTAGLKFFTFNGSSSSTVVTPNETQITESEYFTGITPDFVTIGKKAGFATGVIKLVANQKKIGTQKLYTPKDVDGKTTYVETTIEALNDRLAEFTADNNPQAISARFGRTYYTVPIEHSRKDATAQVGDKKYSVKLEGQYGMVRNHWYQISVGKILKLGHGVFTPEEGEVSNETIIPSDPEDDTYALGANINILSWKVVKQQIDL